MKKIFTLIIGIVFSMTILNAQEAPPQAFSFKATIRDNKNNEVVLKTISLRISILHGTANGISVYSESFRPTTNLYSQVDVEIGHGTVIDGSFSAIDWAADSYFLKVEVDVKGGTNYQVMSVSQLLSVPYALFSGGAANSFSGNYDDLIGVPNLATVSTSGSYYDLLDRPILFSGEYDDLLNPPTLFDGTWGSLSGKPDLKPIAISGSWEDLINTPVTLSGYGITDAISILHPAYAITAGSISNWNTAFDWGDHSELYRPVSYVPSWDDITSNPFAFDTPALEQLLKYDGTNWVNFTPNFLLSEVDGDVTNEIQTLSLTSNELSISKAGDNKIIFANWDIDAGDDVTTIGDQSIAGNKTFTGLLTSTLSANNMVVSNVADPLANQDAATKAYVDVLEARISTLETQVTGLLNLLGVDNDGDGYGVADGDCDDTNETVYPGATEVCGDGIDQDCDGSDLVCVDTDGDGVADLIDNCPYNPNSEQEDSDGDGIGDVCETIKSGDQIVDNDGNIYNTLVIGTQTWTVENLKTTRLNDNSSISLVSDPSAWDATSSPAYCWYKNEELTYKEPFGALYNWYTVNTGNLCPIGWHVPSDEEWMTLENYLIANGYNYDNTKSGNKIAKSLASINEWWQWNEPGTVGNTDFPAKRNCTGFTARPGRWRSETGEFVLSEENIVAEGYWWSSTESSSTDAWHRRIFSQAVDVQRNSRPKGDGKSIRCIKDNSVPDDADNDGYTVAEGDCNDNDPAINPGATEVCGDGIDQDCLGGDLTCTSSTACLPESADPIPTMVRLINNKRIQRGLSPLAPDPRLVLAAQKHADYLVLLGNLSHDGEGGSTFFERCVNEGYTPAIGELVAKAGSDPNVPFNLWFNDSLLTVNHHDIMLLQNAKHLGVGYAGGYWVADLGAALDGPTCSAEETDKDGDGYTVTEGDCDDNDAAINPGATDACGDGIDQNCDGVIDEGEGNNPPVANANGPYIITEGDNLNLVGTWSDIDIGCDPLESLTAGWYLFGNATPDITGISPMVPWAGILERFTTRNQPVDIKLVVTDITGRTAESVTQLTIYDRDFMPCFEVAPSVTAGCSEDLTFDASCTSHPDPRRRFVKYEWYFENTTYYSPSTDPNAFAFITTAVGISQTHVYSIQGTYRPTLRVQDDLGFKMLFQLEVTIVAESETCDGLDNDCDGEVDEGCEDLDGDGFSVSQGDCDDNDPAVYPGASEIAGDGIDQDCDGIIDEWIPETPWVDPQDGYAYKTVIIGDQVWMTEELRATKLNDGTAIPLVLESSTWNSLLTPAYSYRVSYEYDQHKLYYNWHTVNTGKLCPIGWRVPTKSDWQTLLTHIQTNYSDDGSALRTNDHDIVKWAACDRLTQHTNYSQFGAIPNGFRLSDGTFSFGFGYASYWSTSPSDWDPINNMTTFDVDCARAMLGDSPKNNGLNVRCIKE